MNDAIPPVAMNRFEWTWQQFVKAVERNPRLSLNAFCKSVHTHPDGMHTWIRRHGYSVNEIKQSFRESYRPSTSAFACIVPSDNHGTGPEPFLYGISITFNSGTTVTVKQGSVEGVMKLIRMYEKKEGELCMR